MNLGELCWDDSVVAVVDKNWLFNDYLDLLFNFNRYQHPIFFLIFRQIRNRWHKTHVHQIWFSRRSRSIHYFWFLRWFQNRHLNSTKILWRRVCLNLRIFFTLEKTDLRLFLRAIFWRPINFDCANSANFLFLLLLFEIILQYLLHQFNLLRVVVEN